jgi:hypothetical protein
MFCSSFLTVQRLLLHSPHEDCWSCAILVTGGGEEAVNSKLMSADRTAVVRGTKLLLIKMNG